MLITIALWLYLSFITLTYGLGAFVLICKLLRCSSKEILSLPIVFLLGLLALVWLSSLFSLFSKLGALVHALFLVGAFILFYFLRKDIALVIKSEFRGKKISFYLLLLGGIVITLIYAIQPPSNPDTLLYHAQAIRWIEEYPAVPGLGNLDPRLGANSNWFVINAFSSLSFFNIRSFRSVPSFLFLISLWYFLNGFQEISKGQSELRQFVKLGFIPLMFFLLLDELSSPGTDLPVILFYWVILGFWLDFLASDERSIVNQAILFIFSISVITFKVSGALIALAAFWVLVDLIRKRNYRSVTVFLGLAVAFLLPWTLRNFILSGYWLYPEPNMQLLSPKADWAVPVEKVEAFKNGIQAWAIAPRLKENVINISFSERMSLWSENLTPNRKGLVVLALCSPLLYSIFSFLYWLIKGKKVQLFSSPLVVLFTYLNLLFWLINAPNIRFGYGFLIGSIVISLSVMVQLVFAFLNQYRFYLVISVALLLLTQQFYILFFQSHVEYSDYQIWPADYAHVATIPCNVGNVTISCSKNWRQCGYDAFPCIPQERNIELRGDSFRNGFRALQ